MPNRFSNLPDIDEVPEPAPVMTAAVRRLFDLVDRSGSTGISDVHIHPGKPIRLLLHGSLSRVDGPQGIFTEQEIQAWLRYAKPEERDPLGKRGHVSAAMDTGTFRIRCTFRRSTSGTTVTFRVIPTVVPNASEIGVPESIQALTLRDSGLVVVEGPTGSGKSTLNASLVNKINHEANKHIYIVEDPIEFIHTENGSTSIVQREIGIHASDYTTSIEDALRSKPNVIVIGELLDVATTRAALHAATTGHLVITTAHAGSVTEAIDSFIGKFTADEQPQIRSRFAQSMLAVVVQKLVPTVGGQLTAAREVLVNNQNFSELIRTDNGSMIHAQLASNEGCWTMEKNLLDLVHKGAIAPAVAMSAAKQPVQLEEMFRRSGIKMDGVR